MKLSLATALILGVATADMALGVSQKTLMKRMQKGQFNSKTLMQHARRLEDGNEWGITGDYKIAFNSCKSVTVFSEDLFSDEYLYYAQQQEVTSQKSYIVFDVIPTNGGNTKQYMTDIQGYIQSLIEFLPDQIQSYCDTCDQYKDYCQGGQAEEAEEEQNDQGGRRKLANNQVIEYIDCDTCNAYLCYNEQEEQDGQQAQDADAYGSYQEAYQAAYAQGYSSGYEQGKYGSISDLQDGMEWIEGFSDCQQLENAYIFDDQPVYSTFSCNADGSGVTLGTFLDNECTLETNLVSYAYFMNSYDRADYYATKSFLEAIFVEEFDCTDQREVQYVGYDYQAEEEEQQQQQNNDQNEDNEANDYCQNLFEGDMVVSLNDCGYVDGENDQQADNNEEDEAAEQAENDYSWFAYDITEEDADDVQAVCQVVQNLTAQGVSGNNFNDQESEMFDFQSWSGSSASKKSAGAISAAVIGTLLAVTAIAGAAVYFWNVETADSKKTPLMEPNAGTVA